MIELISKHKNEMHLKQKLSELNSKTSIKGIPSSVNYQIKMKIIAILAAVATVNGQDYGYDMEKRGGDARFATGVMGAGFNRISKY